jgi:hypothetical protein
MKSIEIELVSSVPLLMHKDTLVDPLNPATKAHKEMTGKKTKTDDDHIAIAKSEYIAGCYWKKDKGFYIPGPMLEAALINAAKLQKLGVKFRQGVSVLQDELPLVGYEKKTPEQLWEDPDYRDVRGVKVQQNKIMRYRAIFHKWKTNATVLIDERIVNLNDVQKSIVEAGERFGLGDYRPRFGRFSVEFA